MKKNSDNEQDPATPYVYRWDSALEMIRQNSHDRLSSSDPFFNNQIYQVNVNLNMVYCLPTVQRGVFEFPHRTSDRSDVLVLCSEDMVEDAIKAGAMLAGDVTKTILMKRINKGKDFSLIASEEQWEKTKLDLEDVLLPRRMVPNLEDRALIGKDSDFVGEVKNHVQGRYAQFVVTPGGLVHAKLGMEKFPPEWIGRNLEYVLHRLYSIKPAETPSDDYIKSIWLNVKYYGSIKVDFKRLLASAGLTSESENIEGKTTQGQVSEHSSDMDMKGEENAQIAS